MYGRYLVPTLLVNCMMVVKYGIESSSHATKSNKKISGNLRKVLIQRMVSGQQKLENLDKLKTYSLSLLKR